MHLVGLLLDSLQVKKTDSSKPLQPNIRLMALGGGAINRVLASHSS
jgi:hypothetical protein